MDDRTADSRPEAQPFSHLDAQGTARMVDISAKETTVREAIVRGRLRMSAETARLVKERALPKGDVFTVAKVAGIMAAKKTADLIPMCHPIPISGVDVEFSVSDEPPGVEVQVSVKSTAATGVEMEALTAASVALLTVYDMCKSVEKGMVIEGVRLVSKMGGKSGDYYNP